MPRSLSWSAALRDIRQDRTARPDVREERLRSTAGLHTTPALCLTAWRGRSGKRYVASIVDAFDPEAAPAVVIAAKRCPIGIASIVAVEDVTTSEAGAFARAARLAGATELHVHRLAATAAERASIVRDLQ